MKTRLMITLTAFIFVGQVSFSPGLAFAGGMPGHAQTSELQAVGSGHSSAEMGHDHDGSESKEAIAGDHKHGDGEEHDGGAGHHAIAHPFLTHMGLPDGPGEVNIRTNSFLTKTDRGSRMDFGTHLEAGIVDRLGLHYRNDGFKDKVYSEVMLQYAVLRNKAKTSGISVFGQMSIQNSREARDPVQGAFGVSARHVLWNRFALDANVHYNVNEDAWEIEGAGVFKLTDRLFPLLEIRSEIQGNEQPLYLLPGMKVKIMGPVFLGLGVQVPVTGEKEYDLQGLAQLDVSFVF